tara:strand:+ start:296 stop:1111 length:816 start_codon:yes stop_codon:yes gene_type:complete
MYDSNLEFIYEDTSCIVKPSEQDFDWVKKNAPPISEEIQQIESILNPNDFNINPMDISTNTTIQPVEFNSRDSIRSDLIRSNTIRSDLNKKNLSDKKNNKINKSKSIDSNSEECAICYVSKESKEFVCKFNCKHKVCSTCFRKQLQSRNNLVCCYCRKEPNLNKFTEGEKYIYENREEVVDYSRVSEHNEDLERQDPPDNSFLPRNSSIFGIPFVSYFRNLLGGSQDSTSSSIQTEVNTLEISGEVTIVEDNNSIRFYQMDRSNTIPRDSV